MARNKVLPTAELLRSDVREWNRVVRGLRSDPEHCRLELAGISMKSAVLDEADLKGADLSGCDLSEASLAEANLDSAL